MRLYTLTVSRIFNQYYKLSRLQSHPVPLPASVLADESARSRTAPAFTRYRRKDHGSPVHAEEGRRLYPLPSRRARFDSNPEATFSYVAKVLDEYKIAYLHVIEPRIKGDDTLHADHPPVAVKYLRPFFPGPIIAASGFDGASEKHYSDFPT